MNAHDGSEQAYRNGYEAGVKEFAERLKGKRHWDVDIPDYVFVKDIDEIKKEMTEEK